MPVQLSLLLLCVRRGQTENWSDFHRGQHYAAKQLADAFRVAASPVQASETQYDASLDCLIGAVSDAAFACGEYDDGQVHSQKYDALSTAVDQAVENLKGYIDSVRRKPVQASVPAEGEPQIYADGFCARCSELAYPLTRALERTGVPTGADNWQRSYGPNKVRALADFEHCFRRLMNALEEGDSNEIASRISRAKQLIEYHAEVRRRLTAAAQQANEVAAAPSPADKKEK